MQTFQRVLAIQLHVHLTNLHQKRVVSHSPEYVIFSPNMIDAIQTFYIHIRLLLRKILHTSQSSNIFILHLGLFPQMSRFTFPRYFISMQMRQI